MRRLERNWSGGPSGMRAFHIQEWLAVVIWEEALYKYNWEIFVDLVQTVFR